MVGVDEVAVPDDAAREFLAVIAMALDCEIEKLQAMLRPIAATTAARVVH